MRKLRALLLSAAIGTGVLLSTTAAPAHAESIRYVYYLQSDCYNGGNLGIQWGWWTYYHCDLDYASNRWYLWA
ncbi:hypothetical protein Sru01_54410 [Sphaerisporangium rufum]|uniref:Uncharacterized protein n=1 Tax=Sphaerisporangium rufum TaxID=1381558 RepID=A0A919V268_9ACTN|nr:hypothetical protein [Sphaerisporangium rufum]GII80459.1 hypothetical protein Sru01_54410 [Sphaerisporangium rufum]